jgi:hypothetical protein
VKSSTMWTKFPTRLFPHCAAAIFVRGMKVKRNIMSSLLGLLSRPLASMSLAVEEVFLWLIIMIVSIE